MGPTPDSLIRFVDGWRPRRIVVAGDFMLDRYTYGNAERLSPDAPVPVLSVEREAHVPGGASNVCMDLRALRCDVACLGVAGADPAAAELKNTLERSGCDTEAILTLDDRPTTVKHNFVGLAQHRHPQKMFRVDHERVAPLPQAAVAVLLDEADRLLRDAAVLCLEDYNKGVLAPEVCQKLIELADRHGVPVLVDPAAIDDFGKYRGATSITPNRSEAARATGLDGDDEEAWTRMARSLQRKLKLQTVVLTLDRHGALLVEKGQAPRRIPTRARSVYDVTGAGDMVLAMLAGALANEADWVTAVALANTAAGLEVERFGVVPIELSEILVALLEERSAILGKRRELSQLLPELDAYRRQGRRIAFTNGCFDILHAGHVTYLRKAREQGDLLVVAVNADDSIRRIKGPDRPVNHQDDRLEVLAALESVDYVILFHEDTPIPLLEAIRPDVLVKGGDYTHDQVVGADIVEAYGGEVALVDLIEGRSTTNIIQSIQGHSPRG